jgi:hypothetical protein
MDLREIGCEVGRWIELAQVRVQSWALLLAVFNHLVLLTESYFDRLSNCVVLRYVTNCCLEHTEHSVCVAQFEDLHWH